MVLGSSTVVESVASGKNAALEADAYLQGAKPPRFKNRAKSRALLAGTPVCPVPLEAAFFGRPIRSPFLLSAAPHTDGYEQMRAAYERGWSGGVMKTAFDNVPIHIPGEYMFVLGRSTYGNCDNVSGHPLDRVCREVERLVREFPDRLTLASTGGPVTGRDEEDKRVWQANTRKLQNAGAMGVEYSLSCPQGGDGTHGDVVSQNAELTAKIIGWILEASDAANPKLFKLTGAVTAIQPIIQAILEVFARHPGKPAGVTLANSFPSLAFRPAAGRRWDEGVVIGMSGEGVLPISNLTLAKVSALGVTVSGNGGAMTYRDAANFLALGAETVQFCTAVMKYGLGYVDELHSGLSHLLAGPRLPLGARADRLGAPGTDHGLRRAAGHQEAAGGGRRALSALRQLHALPVSGGDAGRTGRAGLRRGALRRLLVVRPEMFRRGPGHAPAHAGGAGGAGGILNAISHDAPAVNRKRHGSLNRRNPARPAPPFDPD